MTQHDNASPTERRKQLRVAGFAPIPVNGKIPPIDKWQTKTETNDGEIDIWAKTFPHAKSTGLLTRKMPTLDVDIKCPDAAAAVEALVRERFEDHGAILVRFGNAPKRAIPFRTDTPFKKITVNLIAPDGDETQKLELLADGQQVVGFGIHKDTGKPYEWFGGEPGIIRRGELPAITESEAQQLVDDAVNLVVLEHGYQRAKDRPKKKRRTNGADDRWDEVGGDNAADDWAYLTDNIHIGRDLHESIRDLAAKLIRSGMTAGAAVNFLYGLMDLSATPHDERWQERRADIPRQVETAEEFIAAAKTDPPDAASSSPDPVDLWGKFDPPELPTGLLPAAIEKYARVEGANMGCDSAGLAMAALTVCAAVISDTIRLQPKEYDEQWTEPARVWAALVGLPSTMKTPILNQAAWPAGRIDRKLIAQYLAEKETYDELPAADKKNRPPPKQPRIKIEDTTIEAAQEVLKDSPDGVLCLQDELSGFFGMMDKHSGKGAGADRAFWMKAYNGGPSTYHRIARGSGLIPNLSVCLLGGIQPDAIRKVAADTMDDGLLQRMLFIVLRPATAGQDKPRDPVVNDYFKLADKLHELLPPQQQGFNDNESEDTVLRFDQGAQTIRNQLVQKHLDLEVALENVNKKLATHVGKYNGVFARLCVLWHCIENVDQRTLPIEVTKDTAQRVARFLHDFILKHAVAFYAGTLGLSDDHERLANVASFILARRLDKATNRDIRRGDRSMRNLTDRDTLKIFEQLEALGWVERRLPKKPQEKLQWIVNPQVHIQFADRAKREADRRADARESVAGIFATAKG